MENFFDLASQLLRELAAGDTTQDGGSKEDTTFKELQLEVSDFPLLSNETEWMDEPQVRVICRMPFKEHYPTV